ncbi:MAG: hypothetical protein ACD_79C00310G0001 [uncultured bacterium]|nr:MAG: hypothetical protein ACD_79C00310G0001 [uncultured bacterium]
MIIGDQLVFRYVFEGNQVPVNIFFASNATLWQSVSMTKIDGNIFYVSMPLNKTYRFDRTKIEYKFIVDGTWIQDPKNLYKNTYENENSYIDLCVDSEGKMHIAEDYSGENPDSCKVRKIINENFDRICLPNILKEIISNNENSIQPLKTALFSQNDTIRHNAIRCLGLMHTKESIKTLVEHITADQTFGSYNKLDRDKWIYDANLAALFLTDNILFGELGLNSIFHDKNDFIIWSQSVGIWNASLEEVLNETLSPDYKAILEAIKEIYYILQGAVPEYEKKAWEPILKYGKAAFLPLKLLLANNNYRSSASNIIWCIKEISDNDESILRFLEKQSKSSSYHLSYVAFRTLCEIKSEFSYDFALSYVKSLDNRTDSSKLFNAVKALAYNWFDRINNKPDLLLNVIGVLAEEEINSKAILSLQEILKDNFFTFIRNNLRNKNENLRKGAFKILLMRNNPEDYKAIIKAPDRISILFDILKLLFSDFKDELQVMITSRCPFNCVHCVAKEVLKNPKSIKDLDFNVLMKLVNELVDVNTFFSGGEPFAYMQNSSKKPSPEIYQVLNNASPQTKTHIITNAYFFPDTKDECYKFLDTLPDGLTIVISLDKAHEKEHLRIKKNIYEIVKLVEQYKEKQRIHIHYSIRLFTSDSRSEQYEILRQYDLTKAYNEESFRFHINNIIEQGGAADADFRNQVTELGWADTSSFHMNNLRNDDVLEHNHLDKAIIYVKPDGSVVTSAHAAFMSNPPASTIIGKITDNNLFEILLDWVISELPNYKNRRSLIGFFKNLKTIYSGQKELKPEIIIQGSDFSGKKENGLTSSQILYLEDLIRRKGLLPDGKIIPQLKDNSIFKSCA